MGEFDKKGLVTSYVDFSQSPVISPVGAKFLRFCFSGKTLGEFKLRKENLQRVKCYFLSILNLRLCSLDISVSLQQAQVRKILCVNCNLWEIFSALVSPILISGEI